MAPLCRVVDDLLRHHIAKLDEKKELKTPVELVRRLFTLRSLKGMISNCPNLESSREAHLLLPDGSEVLQSVAQCGGFDCGWILFRKTGKTLCTFSEKSESYIGIEEAPLVVRKSSDRATQ